MGVIFESQTIVPDIMCRIFRFHHGSQGNGLDEVLLLLTLTGIHQRIQRLRDSTLGTCRLHLIAELDNKLTQGFQLGGVGLVVNAIDKGFLSFWLWALGFWLIHFAYMFSNGAVGKQHKFLDELCGIVRFLKIRTDRFTLFVDIEMQFLAVELDGTALETTFTQFLGQTVKRTQFLGIGVSTRLARFTRGTRYQNILYFLIRVPSITLDDSMDNAVVLDVGFIVQSEDYTIT